MDPLTEKYIEVLNEKTDSGVVKTSLKTGHSFEGTEKLNKADDADKNVAKDIDKPEEDKNNSCDEKDGAMEKAPKVESSNPFETLYNKILQEDAFGWEIEDAGSTDMGDISSEVPSLEDGEDDEDESEEDESEEVTLTLDKEMAQKLMDMLQAAVGGDTEEGSEESEESDEEEFDLGDSDEEESEEDDETVKEEVDAEVVGHALVDQEKLSKSMNKPSNHVVKSTIKAHKKKAHVPTTGKGFKGELTKQSDSAGKALQNKNNKVAAVNVGKGIIDNK
jgi:hypothetical protein